MEAVLELLCVYTASFTTGLCVCVCMCMYLYCMSSGTAPVCGDWVTCIQDWGQHCLPWLPLSNIVSHCLPPVPACLLVTIDTLLWQQVPDQRWCVENWIAMLAATFFGSNSKILRTGNAWFMWPLQVCNRSLYHQEVPVYALSTSLFDWHLFLSESVHSDLNLLALSFSYAGAVKPQKSVKSGIAFP